MDSVDGAPRTTASEPGVLNRSRTVEREFVHRLSVAEVFLTDVRALGDGRFEAAASWPRSHPTFPRGRDERHSPMVLVETMRQLGIYIPLRFYGVCPTAHFLIKDVSFTIDPALEPRVDHGLSEITCLARVTQVRNSPSGALGTLRMRVRFLAGGTSFAHAEGGARVLGAGAYAQLRGRSGGAVREPERAGPPLVRPAPAPLEVTAACDVVVGLDGDDLLLDPADPRHPFLFDHGTDHVPGMALLEAARQAVALRSGGLFTRPLAGRLQALRFTEHTPLARVECALYPHVCAFRVRQNGTHTAVGALRYG